RYGISPLLGGGLEVLPERLFPREGAFPLPGRLQCHHIRVQNKEDDWELGQVSGSSTTSPDGRLAVDCVLERCHRCRQGYSLQPLLGKLPNKCITCCLSSSGLTARGWRKPCAARVCTFPSSKPFTYLRSHFCSARY